MSRYLRCCEAQYVALATLTYPDGEHWRDAKRHLRSLLARLRRRAARDGGDQPWSAFWFLEFQRNGRPHFHLFLTHPVPRDELARSWFEIVGSDDPRHLRAGTRIEFLRRGRSGCISYARKYAAKHEQKTLPPLLENQGFGRWWGVVGCVDLVAAGTSLGTEDLRDESVRKARAGLQEALAEGRKQGLFRRFRHQFAEVWCLGPPEAEKTAAFWFWRLHQAVEVARARRLSQQTEPICA